MQKDKIFKDLENLFKDNPYVKITTDKNSISFSHEFSKDMHRYKTLYSKHKGLYTYTIRIHNNEYILSEKTELPAIHSFRNDETEARGYYWDVNGDVQTWNPEYIKRPIKAYMSKTGLKQKETFKITATMKRNMFIAGWILGLSLLAFIVSLLGK